MRETTEIFSKSHTTQEHMRIAWRRSDHRRERGKLNKIPTAAPIRVWSDGNRRGRCKLHRGRVVEGNWILGMIDINTKEVCMSICPNNRQDTQTLYDLVFKYHSHRCMEGLQWLVNRRFGKPFNNKPLLAFCGPDNPCAHQQHRISLAISLT